MSLISLLDLSLSAQHAARFQNHPRRLRSFHAYDLAGYAASLVLGAALLLQHTGDATSGTLFPMQGLSQVAQLSTLATLLLYRTWHVPRSVNLLQRLLGLGSLVHRYWLFSSSGIAGAAGYQALASQSRLHAPAPRFAPPALLLEPLLALISVLSHGVPFKDHVKLLAARVAIDVGLVLPCLACVLTASGAEYALVVRACEWMMAGFGGATWRGGSSPSPTLLCSPFHSEVFVASLLTITLGWLLPTVLAYFTELQAKLGFLSDVQQRELQQEELQQQAHQLPGQWELLVMLLVMLLVGVIAACTLSELIAMWLTRAAAGLCPAPTPPILQAVVAS
jgi:hypothetical protein